MKITAVTSINNILNDENIVLCGNNDILKANIDIENSIIYMGLSSHADMEEEMLSEGAERGNLVGINIFIDELIEGEPLNMDMVEFSSMINFDVNKRIGDLRAGNYINNNEIKAKTMEILNKWLTQ